MEWTFGLKIEKGPQIFIVAADVPVFHGAV